MRHKRITDMAPLVFVYRTKQKKKKKKKKKKTLQNSFAQRCCLFAVLVGYPYVAFVGFYLHPMFVGTLDGAFRGSPELAVVLGILYHIIFLMYIKYRHHEYWLIDIFL
jgi:uncharacterized protein YqhQ